VIVAVFLILALAAVAIIALTTTTKVGGDLVQRWALAIQSHEGWFSGSRAYRNNNPGNLKIDGDLGRDEDGFAKFSSYEAGFSALQADLRAKLRIYPDFSILQIMTRWLGGDPSDPKVTGEGDPFRYADVVAAALGASPNTKLRDLGA